MSSISNKAISDYLESQGIRHANVGFRYLMLGIRLSLDGKVNYGRINSVYEAIGLEAGVTVGRSTAPSGMSSAKPRSLSRTRSSWFGRWPL